MLFQDRTLWQSFLSHCHQVNSKFTPLIVSLFMVSVVKSLNWNVIFFIHVLWSRGLKWAWWILGIEEFKYVMQSKMGKFYSLIEQATQGQTTLLVVTGGTVKFEGNKLRFFNQNFLLTAQATPNSDQPVWKIASDCFRFQDWNSWAPTYWLLCNKLKTKYKMLFIFKMVNKPQWTNKYKWHQYMTNCKCIMALFLKTL